MHMNEQCASCMMNKQRSLSDDSAYLDTIQKILSDHFAQDSAPRMAYRFAQAYEERFGKPASYAAIRKQYNDLVLSLTDQIREKIEAAADPLFESLLYARTGNYIDFAAMEHVEPETLIAMLGESVSSENDRITYASFLKECETAERFLLLADNCGEIVLDRLVLEQLQKRFPNMKLTVLVRGGEVLNDALIEDAEAAGIAELAEVLDSGYAAGGTVIELMKEEALAALDAADVILAKGQGNYEGLSHCGYHVFYLFLCKCQMFADRFQVPRLTGMFTEEK